MTSREGNPPRPFSSSFTSGGERHDGERETEGQTNERAGALARTVTVRRRERRRLGEQQRASAAAAAAASSSVASSGLFFLFFSFSLQRKK